MGFFLLCLAAAVVAVVYTGYPSRFYATEGKTISVHLDQRAGGPMVETEFLWIQATMDPGSVRIDLSSAEHEIGFINVILPMGYFDEFVIRMRKFEKGNLGSPEDACVLSESPSSKNGAIFRQNNHTLRTKPTKFDAKIRIYEREVYVHRFGKLLMSCVAPKTHRFVLMSKYEAMIHHIEVDFMNVKPLRVSIEQTMYPFPYYEEFVDYGFRDGQLIIS
ncbi:unnamed protein product [Toxocara canis]|uniref:DUF58 domain-containing protein n=1 Tax=Toxocara canis TaxID=6265 RepID=A0A183VAT8_TOXCA|nr:unnamed protein product [Toxocara canis]